MFITFHRPAYLYCSYFMKEKYNDLSLDWISGSAIFHLFITFAFPLKKKKRKQKNRWYDKLCFHIFVLLQHNIAFTAWLSSLDWKGSLWIARPLRYEITDLYERRTKYMNELSYSWYFNEFSFKILFIYVRRCIFSQAIRMSCM